MSEGRPSVATDAELDHMFGVFHAFRPSNDTDIAFYEEAIVKLNDLVGSRRVRLDAAMEEMPPDLLVLLIGGEIVLVSLTLLFGVSNFRLHAVMVASVAGLMAFSVMLAIVMDYPFSGALVHLRSTLAANSRSSGKAEASPAPCPFGHRHCPARPPNQVFTAPPSGENLLVHPG